MRQIDEILRLRYDLGCSQQAIANATGIARSTVKDYLLRAKTNDLNWPLPADMTNKELNTRLFPATVPPSQSHREEPDWQVIHKELKRKAVTIQLLWEEYKRQQPNGYQYSWFAHRYRHWAKRHEVWMPQVHKAGEKVFVDYSGLTIPIWSTNLQTVLFEAEIFVSVLGGSDLIFCTATQTQKIADWITAHNLLFAYYGGVTDLIVPDNLRSAVTHAHRYEPQCQSTYEELARHYSCAIMPARSYKPKDKAKAEKAVQLVQQRILAVIRDERFCSLKQLNRRIHGLLEALNDRHSKAFGCSRRELFQTVEQAALKPLPGQSYELALWKQAQVNGSYHITVHQHHYSVPYHFVRKQVDIRITQRSIEVFYRDERIACHQREDTVGVYSTLDSHRPEAHRQQAQWTHQRLIPWAQQIGAATSQLVLNLFADKKRHLHQKERSALGILRLSHAYSDGALERACKQALSIGTYRYDSIASLIKRQPSLMEAVDTDCLFEGPDHRNVRGSAYYH
jgi:transposase